MEEEINKERILFSKIPYFLRGAYFTNLVVLAAIREKQILKLDP